MNIDKILAYLLDNWIAIAALIFSLPSCVFGIINYRNSIPKLKIDTECDVNYLVGFMYYSEWRLAIANLRIDNVSTIDISMSEISLTADGKTYYPILKSFPTQYSRDGIFLQRVDTPNVGRELKIYSDNLLNTPRIESHGSVYGYLVFSEIPNIKKHLSGTLEIKTPTKTFKSKILFIPLPKQYKTTFKQLSE